MIVWKNALMKYLFLLLNALFLTNIVSAANLAEFGEVNPSICRQQQIEIDFSPTPVTSSRSSSPPGPGSKVEGDTAKKSSCFCQSSNSDSSKSLYKELVAEQRKLDYCKLARRVGCSALCALVVACIITVVLLTELLGGGDAPSTNTQVFLFKHN